MLNIYRVSFMGYREIYSRREGEARLEQIIFKLMQNKEYVEFYIGCNGDFDIVAASVIKRVKSEFGKHNSALTLVLLYTVKNIGHYEKYYDDVIIPVFSKTHY